jgi:hypothetical protein
MILGVGDDVLADLEAIGQRQKDSDLPRPGGSSARGRGLAGTRSRHQSERMRQILSAPRDEEDR